MKLRLVKFLTSRENEIEKKEGGEGALPSCALPPPSQAAASAIAPLRSRSPPPFIFPSFPSSPSAQPATCRPSLSAATCRSSYSFPAVPLLPSFFIKLPKQQGMAYVAWRCTQPAGPDSRFSHSGAQLVAPLPLHQIRRPRLLSGSNGILSVAGGAIGKQRPKINYPVSFPSLLNK